MTSTTGTDRPPNILVIEDEPLIAMGLRLALENMGCRIHAIVDNEEEAVAQGGTEGIDLILADVRLKSGNGIDAVRRILERKAVPVLFITGNPGDLAHRGMGHMDVLAKPFMPAVLERTVRRLLVRGPAESA